MCASKLTLHQYRLADEPLLGVYLTVSSGAVAICCATKSEKLSSKTPSFLHATWGSLRQILTPVLVAQAPGTFDVMPCLTIAMSVLAINPSQLC